MIWNAPSPAWNFGEIIKTPNQSEREVDKASIKTAKKPIPFEAAYTYIAQIWEYPPPPPLEDKFHLEKMRGLFLNFSWVHYKGLF